MDWRSLLDERQRREMARRQGGFGMATTSTPSPLEATEQQKVEDRGFFGDLVNAGSQLARPVKAVGGFFGGMVQDLAETTVEAGKTVRDVALSPIKQKMATDLQKEANELLREARKKTEDWTEEDWANPEKKAINQAEIDKAKAILKQSSQIIGSDTIKDRDAKKSAAATAETFLNIATAGAAGAVVQGAKTTGKQGIKQGIKTAAKEVVLGEGLRSAGKMAARETAVKGAGEATKRIARNAATGAMIGGGYGALQPWKTEGDEATTEDVWRSALTGGLFGGALGGAATLADRNVRAGVREIPGAVKKGGGEAVDALNPETVAARHPSVLGFDDQYQQLALAYDNAPSEPARQRISQAMAQNRADRLSTMRQISQGGYVGRGPAGPEDLDIDRMLAQNTDQRPAAELQRGLEDAWNSNKLDEAQEIIDQMPEDMRVSMQSIQDYRVRESGGPSAATAMDDVSRSAETARRQLAGEDMAPLSRMDQEAEDLAQQTASGYANTEEYIAETARRALDAEQGVQGGQMIPDGEGGYRRTSDHLPWYRDLYGETGRKPTLQATKDLVRDALETGRGVDGVVYPEESRVYQLLLDREQGFAQTMAEGPPRDMAATFMDDLGIPSSRTRRRGPGGPVVNPYEGATPDFNRLALPAGPEPLPPTPAAARRQFKQTGEAPEFVNRQRPGTKPIELPADVTETRDIAMRQTPGGKIKPLANNNAHITRDQLDAIKAIADDDTGSSFTVTRTPEMNLEEAFRKRGGANSKEFRELDKFNISIREHTGQYMADLDQKRSFFDRFMKEFGIDGKKAQDMRPYLEAATPEDSTRLLSEYQAKHGDKAAEGLRRLRDWWRTEKDVVRNATNEQIVKYAGEKRMMGDLGETYVPRVYKRGAKGLRNSVLDVAHAGLDKISGKKGMFNLENGTGYMDLSSNTMGGIARNTEGIPLNSEMAKPNTTFLSAAQKRTAKSPIGELEDPITSMMRYFEATGRARYLTEDVARGRTLQKAIEYVNNETGNLRQVYKSFEDQINAVAGKTSRIDRPVVDSKTGAGIVNAATKVQSKIARSTILGSASSAVAQTGNLPLAVSETGPQNFTKGMQDMFRFIRGKADDPLEKSALMTARYPKNDQMFAVKKSTKLGNKGTAVISKPFRLIEKASSELTWRASYNRALKDGFTGKEAVQEADRIAAKIIGERSAGARAALYESKALGPVTSYTLEVNQLYQVAKQYFKRDPKKAATLVGAIWLYNQGFSAVTGNKLNADPADAALDVANILTSEDYLDDEGLPIGLGERLTRSAGRLGGEFIDATPLGGPVAGQLYPERGFRIPFGGGDRMLARDEIFGDTNFGRYGGGTPIASGISNPLLMLGVPGMGQVQRSAEGQMAFNEGGSFTPSGDLRFLIEQDPENYWRTLLFGPYSAREGRDYLGQRAASLAGQSQQGGLRY